MKKAYLCLILHAHMPYVLDIKNEDTLEERWLYEAFTNCYLRLIQVFDRLANDHIPFSITFSLSPILLAQLENPQFSKRLVSYINRQILLAENEITRTPKIPEIVPLAKMYKTFYEQALFTFENRCQCNPIEAFRAYQEKGQVQIITCPATHPYLPLLKPTLSGIKAQINCAVKEYQRLFKAHHPLSGLWLPECGYFPGLDHILKATGIKFTFLDTDTFLQSVPKPRFGTFIPIISEAEVIAFGRDINTAKQVWSSTDGYPGDSDYRDFYRDIGFDLDIDYIQPFLPIEGRSYTGFKYYRIESHDGHKMIYDPLRAERKVAIHADDFILHRLNQIREISDFVEHPIICAFYDAELFGHWWFEGPLWIETLFRKLVECKDFLILITPSDYIAKVRTFENAQPLSGSWGWKGYNEVWLNDKNGWIYPHLFRAGEKLEKMAGSFSGDGVEEMALNQAAKELMLAQSSDWAFILHNNTFPDYATQRIKEHIGCFWKLIKQIENHTVDITWLKALEKKDQIFPTLSYKDYCLG